MKLVQVLGTGCAKCTKLKENAELAVAELGIEASVEKIEENTKIKVKDIKIKKVKDKSKIIDEVEPGSLRLPVLIKKYIKQNAKVVAFNVDPLFNNAVDGLMYIRIADLPESTVRPVMEEFQAELERKFNNTEEP